MLEKEGAPPTMEVLLAENDDYHDMFMKLKDEGDLPGKHIVLRARAHRLVKRRL